MGPNLHWAIRILYTNWTSIVMYTKGLSDTDFEYRDGTFFFGPLFRYIQNGSNIPTPEYYFSHPRCMGITVTSGIMSVPSGSGYCIVSGTSDLYTYSGKFYGAIGEPIIVCSDKLTSLGSTSAVNILTHPYEGYVVEAAGAVDLGVNEFANLKFTANCSGSGVMFIAAYSNKYTASISPEFCPRTNDYLLSWTSIENMTFLVNDTKITTSSFDNANLSELCIKSSSNKYYIDYDGIHTDSIYSSVSYPSGIMLASGTSVTLSATSTEYDFYINNVPKFSNLKLVVIDDETDISGVIDTGTLKGLPTILPVTTGSDIPCGCFIPVATFSGAQQTPQFIGTSTRKVYTEKIPTFGYIDDYEFSGVRYPYSVVLSAGEYTIQRTSLLPDNSGFFDVRIVICSDDDISGSGVAVIYNQKRDSNFIPYSSTDTVSVGFESKSSTTETTIIKNVPSKVTFYGNGRVDVPGGVEIQLDIAGYSDIPGVVDLWRDTTYLGSVFANPEFSYVLYDIVIPANSSSHIIAKYDSNIIGSLWIRGISNATV